MSSQQLVDFIHEQLHSVSVEISLFFAMIGALHQNPAILNQCSKIKWYLIIDESI